MENKKVLSSISGKVIKVIDSISKDEKFKDFGQGILIKPSDKFMFNFCENASIEFLNSEKNIFYLNSEDLKILFLIDDINHDDSNKISFLKNKDINVNEVFAENTNIKEIYMFVNTDSVKNAETVNIEVREKQIIEKGNEIFSIAYNKNSNTNKTSNLFKQKVGTKSFNYKEEVQEIYNFIGKQNYSKVYNCITRLRFRIIDFNKVEIDKIKKIKIVKGTNIVGDELQIIIGPNVSKVKESFDNYVYEINGVGPIDLNKKTRSVNKPKISKKKKIILAFSGILNPVIPILIVFGMLQAVKALLTITNALGTDPTSVSVWLFNAITDVGLSFILIAFTWSTVKYFKGNEVIAIFIGLTLCNPYLLASGNSWIWFEINTKILGDVPIEIGITNYISSVLPGVIAGILFVLIDNWIKKWMPNTLDIIFRPLLGFSATVVLMFFVFGPVSKLFEGGIGVVVVLLSKIPYGIGLGLFAFFLPPLILTGLHHIVVTIMTMQVITNPPQLLMTAGMAGILTQMGATVGVYIATKRKGFKQTIAGALPSALLGGITEPIMYGVNLVKPKSFLSGMIGGFASGLLIGILNVRTYSLPAGGVFGVIGYIEGGAINTLNYCIAIGVGVTLACLLTVFTYSDRKKENSLLKQFNKQIKKILIIEGRSTQKTNDEFKKINSLISKKDVKEIGKFEKCIIQMENLNIQMENLNKKAEQKLERDQQKKKNNLKSAPSNTSDSQPKTDRIALKKQKLSDDLFKLGVKKLELDKNFSNWVHKKEIEILNEYKFLDNINEINLEKINFNISNILNNLKIEYNLLDKDEREIDFKKLIKNLKQPKKV